MLKGTIYITYDINLCMANLNNCKTIAVVDEPDNYNIPGKIGGSILLPPYEALMCVIDGDDIKFQSYYTTYLCSDITVRKFINIVLQAVMVGTNIILLLDPEAPKFDMVLKQYFAEAFGIIIGDESRPFMFDINYFPGILNRLYLDDSIEKEWFLNLYPLEVPFSNFALQKLSYEYQLFTLPDSAQYFKKLSKLFKNGGSIRNVVERI